VPAHPIRLVVAARSSDIHRRVRAALSNGGIDVVGAQAAVDELSPELLMAASIVLIEAGELKPPETKQIRAFARGRAQPFLILAGGADEKTVRRAMAAGAAGVVRKADLERTLEPAVHAALAGLACFPLDVRIPSVTPVLTTREKQILAMVVLGMSNAEIGRRLQLTESTIKSHLSSCYAKLGVRGRNEATAAILDPTDGFGMGILHISDPKSQS
jgi:DNA-binding NarL/FixJ family response regulator